ncbi:MAG: hypothetical protein M3Q51_01920 [Pseudomonadota bacterium]|nr:hypothetical protein [Pseudomonadota bacterium]
MTMATKTHPHDDDMPAEIDFSQGTRGKFFTPNTTLRLPVYLDPKVRDYLAERAQVKGIEVDQFVNDLLQHDIEIIEAAR